MPTLALNWRVTLKYKRSFYCSHYPRVAPMNELWDKKCKNSLVPSVVSDLNEDKWLATFDRSLSQLSTQSQNSHLIWSNLVLKSCFVSSFKKCNLKFTRFSPSIHYGTFLCKIVIFEYSYISGKNVRISEGQGYFEYQNSGYSAHLHLRERAHLVKRNKKELRE